MLFNSKVDNYCKHIYIYIFTYNNVIIILKIFFIIVLYYISKYLKSINYFILIDEFILYFVNSICSILLIIRLLYSYYIINNINKNFYKIQICVSELFSLYLSAYNDIIDDSNDIVIHNRYNKFRAENINGMASLNFHNQINNKNILEFKDLLLFYISYFIILISSNNSDSPFNYTLIVDTRIYENFLYNKLSNYYYHINNNITKLYFININIKTLLNDNYIDNSITSNVYNNCIIKLNEINELINVITKFYSNDNIINDKKILYFLNYFNSLLIFLSIILSIIYYINYLTDISIIYILIISYVYIFLNLYITAIIDNYLLDSHSKNNIDLNSNISNTDWNLRNYLKNIQDEINMIYSFSIDRIDIVFK